jgi:aryl-alcohol dehydrogenase-like predicted oxidoreductase
MRRREFLRTSLAVAAATGLAACAKDAGGAAPEPPGRLPPSTLPQRPLGSTGVSLPILALGGFHLGGCADEAAARALLETALQEGVRFLDTAESYQDGRSESWLGAGLAALGVRDEVFLMTKTFKPDGRTAESAKRDLDASLSRLRTDRLDLWQLHSIQSVEDVDRAFAPGGAMEFIRGQQAAGVVRFVGVTGHVNPAAHRRALEWWDRGVRFDVVQMPVNPLDAHQLSFQNEVLPGLRERGLGVLAMKTAAGGALVQKGVCAHAECLRYVWSLPVDVAVVGMETPEQVRVNAALARGAAMDGGERAALLARIERFKDLSLEWYKKA